MGFRDAVVESVVQGLKSQGLTLSFLFLLLLGGVAAYGNVREMVGTFKVLVEINKSEAKIARSERKEMVKVLTDLQSNQALLNKEFLIYETSLDKLADRQYQHIGESTSLMAVSINRISQLEQKTKGLN